MFWSGRKKIKSDASVLFIFIAAVGTLILATAVLEISSVKRTVVEEKAPVPLMNNDSSLPEGIIDSARRMDIELLAEPATVLAYRQNGRQMLGLMKWDRRSGKNALKTEIVLHGTMNQAELPELSVKKYGWSQDLEVELRWSAANSDLDVLTHVMVDGTQLKQLKIERADGISRYELFEEGDTVLGETSIEIKDMDNDGVAELLAETIDSYGNRVVDVYLWAGDRLAWNESWSRAMTARDGLFPEPGE